MCYLKDFISKLKSLDHSKSALTVFKDFLTLSYCSLAQVLNKDKTLEQKYLETIKNYTKKQAEEFSQLLAFLVMGLEEKHQDFLGQIYMQLNFGNVATGQFWTPYHVAKFMAEVNFNEVKETLNKNIITLSEPCCGSGCLVIAFAETMKNNGYNYQNQLFVEAIDIDEMCFMMTFVQFTLLGISARVILGDTLAYKFKKVVYTPFYYLNGFEWKLRQLKQNEDIKEIEVNSNKTIQLKLF